MPPGAISSTPAKDDTISSTPAKDDSRSRELRKSTAAEPLVFAWKDGLGEAHLQPREMKTGDTHAYWKASLGEEKAASAIC
jgi:hypothetical protein